MTIPDGRTMVPPMILSQASPQRPVRKPMPAERGRCYIRVQAGKEGEDIRLTASGGESVCSRSGKGRWRQAGRPVSLPWICVLMRLAHPPTPVSL